MGAWEHRFKLMASMVKLMDIKQLLIEWSLCDGQFTIIQYAQSDILVTKQIYII